MIKLKCIVLVLTCSAAMFYCCKNLDQAYIILNSLFACFDLITVSEVCLLYS